MQKRISWHWPPQLAILTCGVWLALGDRAKVSSVLPQHGSIAGGTHIVVLGSGFRDPSGPNPFGFQSVSVGGEPCTILEDFTTSEQILCETPAGHEGPPVPVCLRLHADGPCEPSCAGCRFQYTEEETPYISWISGRALSAGDQIAFGAADPGALQVSGLDRALIEIGSFICDAGAHQVLNSDDFFLERRTLNCVLADTAGPGLSWLRIRALPMGLDDPNCAHYPCTDHSSQPRGFGFAVFRAWQGQAELPPAFLDGDFKPYDLTIHPDILGISPGFSGILGGATINISGRAFDPNVSKTTVMVGTEPCQITQVLPGMLMCELADLQENVSCIDFEVFVGGSPFAGTKSIQYNANVMEIASCPQAEGKGADFGRQFTVSMNISSQHGYYWTEDSCQAEGQHVRGEMVASSEERLTFCCAMDGTTCEGPRLGQVTTSLPTYWEGWGTWVQIGTTTENPMFGSCLPPLPHRDALRTCELKGMRLCTRMELNSGICCSADCSSSDGTAAWTSDEGYLQELVITADDGEPWEEELWIRCEEKCSFPFNVTYPDPGNETTTTTTKYSPAEIALWEFAPWLRPDDYIPPEEQEGPVPLGPPVPEPLRPFESPHLLAPFAGNRGLRYSLYANPDNLPVHRALGSSNAGYPQSPLMTGTMVDVLRGALTHVKFDPVPQSVRSAKRTYVAGPPLMDDTGHDFYAEEITGFFVAPYTANYSFYLAADDEADLSLSCCGDMAGMKVIVRSEKVDFAMPRYTPLAWYGSCQAAGTGSDEPECSISKPVDMSAGDRVLMRVRHRDHVAADWLRVGLRVHMPIQSAEGSMPHAEIVRRKSFIEVQRLTMTANVVRERHRMNFLRVLTGSFRVRVRRFAQNFLREGVSGVLRVGATAAELAQTLWDTMDLYGRVLECEPTLERTEDADNAVLIYFVTFPCPRQADGNPHADALDIVPGLDVIATGREGWVMNSAHLQSASELVQGSFRLHFRGQWTEAISYQGWQDVQRQLLMLPGLGDVRIWPFAEVLQEGREGWSVGLLLPGESGGGEDMPQIHVDGSRLSGPGVRLSIDTLANGSQDLFFEEIPADWFRTPNLQPQVVVESNGVVASADDVSFRRSEDFTPRLMDLDPLVVQVGSELSLRFDRVDGNHLRDVTLREGREPFAIFVGPSRCNLTSYACENGEERNCGSFPEVWNVMCTVLDGRAGDQEVQVIVDAQGQAQYTNVTIAMPMPSIGFVPQIDLVQPSMGSWAGGTVVVIVGSGLQGPEACQLLTFGNSSLLEVSTDVFEDEMIAEDEFPGRRVLRCMVPPAEPMPMACEIFPHLGECLGVDDRVLSVSVAGYATDWNFTYSRSLTPLVDAVTPSRLSAATSGFLHLSGRGFPAAARLLGGAPPAAKDIVVRVAGQRCRIEASSSMSLTCFLARRQPGPVAGTAAQIELWALGAGHAVLLPGTSIDDSFAVSEVTPKHGSLHGGVTLDVSGYGFDADPMRHEIFIRVAMSNGTIQDLPCPLRPAASLQGRRLKCEAPSLPPELLHYTRTAQEGGLDELLGRVIVRLNGIESSCLPMDAELSCTYRFARASTPSVVEVTPLEGATLEHEAPLVRIVVAGWDGAHGSDLAQVFFGSQECEVNFTKRLVQPCPDCGSGHCVSNVLNADMAEAASGDSLSFPPVACKCDPGWYGPLCRDPCACVYPGTVSCNDGADGDGKCSCVDLHNGTNCESCDEGYYRSRPDGFCDVFCTRNETCSNFGDCTERGECQCDLWYFGDSCDCSCNSRGICVDGACRCDARWDGDFCETPGINISAALDECTNCSTRGICVEDDDDGFVCECLATFYGDNCERTCSDCLADNTMSCSEGFCTCKQGFWGPHCENTCSCSSLGTSYCDPSDGTCSCNRGWQGTTCSECAPKYYPAGSCHTFCDGATTCNGFGVCGDAGECVCIGARSVESSCSQCLPHYYPAQDARIILGYPDPPARFAQEWQIVEIDCPSEDDENTSEENDSNDTMSNDTMSPIGMLNDSDDSVNAANISNVPLEDLSGEDKRCFANVSVNVSLNVTGDVEPFVMVIEACSRFCNPATTCSGFGVCDPISAECQCDSEHFSSDCSGVCADYCETPGTEKCALETPEASTPTCTCKSGYWDSDCRWSCTCFEAGTLRCIDGSTGDGSCVCNPGFIGFACDSCAAYMYPPGECFRRCEENVDCFEGSCTPFTGICACEAGWEGSNCGCSVDMSPTDSCGGKGFCADDGSCLCDIRNTGAECADSTAYELAELQCPYCSNTGICVEENGGFACSCAKKLGYYGDNCEVYCTTCNADNTRTCAITGGVEQCFCEEWWWGPDCSLPCACIRAGTEQCLMQTGQCACKTGWAGLFCEQCSPGYYPEGSCDVQCDAGFSCNLNGYCGPLGTCVCNDLWEGEGCTYCTFDGRPLAHDNSTDLPSCSTRCADATICSGHGACTNVGLCDCDPGWYGGPVACWDRELAAARGWYRTDGLPDCDIQLPLGPAVRMECHQKCTCSYPGTDFCREGRTGDGLCVCHYGWGGNDCERCAEGFFPAPETQSPSCTTFCSSPVTCSGHGMCNVFGICECDEGWAGVNCDRCADNWYPLGSCNVYCTFEETCSYHGRCNSDGICLCDDGWMTGTRSRYQYLEDMFSLDDLFPLGNSTDGDVDWQCLSSCIQRYGLDAVETDSCMEECVAAQTTTSTSTSGEPTRAVEAMINSSNASNDSEEEAMDGNGTDSDTEMADSGPSNTTTVTVSRTTYTTSSTSTFTASATTSATSTHTTSSSTSSKSLLSATSSSSTSSTQSYSSTSSTSTTSTSSSESISTTMTTSSSSSTSTTSATSTISTSSTSSSRSTTSTSTTMSSSTTSSSSITSSTTSTSSTSSSSKTSSTSSSTTISTTSSTSSTSSVTSTSSTTTHTQTSTVTTTTNSSLSMVNISDLELCIEACQDALVAFWQNASGSQNISANLTATLAATCLKQCLANGTATVRPEEPPTRFCSVLDVTLFRVNSCPVPGGKHSIAVKPTPGGFASRASLSEADYDLEQQLTVVNMDPFGSPVAGGKVITVHGVGFPQDVDKAHIVLDQIGPCEVLQSTQRELTCVTPYISPQRFALLWNTSGNAFFHSDGSMVLPVPVYMAVGRLVPQLLKQFSRCVSEDMEDTIRGLTLQDCAKLCTSRYTSRRCTAFSHGYRGSAVHTCSILSDPLGCHHMVHDVEFHAYAITDADSNGTVASWPALTLTTTVVSVTSTTVTHTAGPGNTTVTETTTSSISTTSTESTTSSRTTTSSTSTASQTTSTSTSKTQSSTTTTSVTTTSMTTTSLTATSSSITATSSTSSSATQTSSTETSSTRTTSTSSTHTQTSTQTSTTTTERTSTTTKTGTSTSTSSTVTTATTTVTSVTTSTTSTTSRSSTTTSTTTTTTSLDPEALAFLVEDHGPQATSMAPTTGPENTTLVIHGQGLGMHRGAVYFVEPGSAYATSGDASSCDVTSWQSSEVECLVPPLAAGAYQVHVRVPNIGDAVAPEPFIAPLLLAAVGPVPELEMLLGSNGTDHPEEATAVLQLRGSMAGGQELLLIGAGFGHAKEATQVTVCGAPCEVLHSNHSEVRCRTPLLLTDGHEVLEELPLQDLRPYFGLQLGVSGWPFRPEELRRAVDGAVDEDVVLSGMDACSIEFDAGPEALIILSSLAFYAPPEASLRMDLVGSAFQTGFFDVMDGNYTPEEPEEPEDFRGCDEANDSNSSNQSNGSDCNITLPRRVMPGFTSDWQTVWALEVQPSVGWNHRTFDPPLHFERLRLLGPQGLGAGGCRVREISMRGHVIAKPPMGCPVEVTVSNAAPAVAVADEAPLEHLVLDAKAVGAGQLQLSPRGSISFWLTVAAAVTDSPQFQIEAAVLPDEHWPLQSVTLQINSSMLSDMPSVPDLSDEMTFLSDGEAAMTWSSVASLALPSGLWKVEIFSPAPVPLQLGRLRSLTPGVQLLPAKMRTKQAVVSPRLDMTPFVMSIVPSHGPFSGGTSLILAGSGLLCNETSAMQDISVVVRGTRCAVSFATDSEIHCTTGAASWMGGKAEPEVVVAGCGKSMSAATATFTYVSRWSDPTDWPFNEPPISTDQTWIPPGSHVILDVPTEPLGLLRLEGHLQMDLHAEDLSLRAERIWVRGGALMAEPSAEEESNGTRLERQSANFSIVMTPARIMNQVTSVPVEVPGVPRFGLTVTDRFEMDSPWASGHGRLLLRGSSSRLPRAAKLETPATHGSHVLRLDSAIDVVPGEHVLVMGGARAPVEEHVVSALEDDGRMLLLQTPLLADREGGMRSLTGIEQNEILNFGEVDLAATVAAASSGAHFYGEDAHSAHINCLRSGGTCGLESLTFSACGSVSPGSGGVPCANLKALYKPEQAFVRHSLVRRPAGPGLILQAGLEETSLVAQNILVISSVGPAITLTTRGAAAANNTESLTVHHNQVVSPRRSAVGLPFLRQTVAFKIMTGTAAYRHNFATKAEACFSFEPREDSELVPRSPHLVGRQSSRWSLVAFEGNAAHDCLYGLRVPQELRQGNSQVFTDFTVFASQYAYYVRACDRCRLVNSAWVETTAGVYDEDSAPVVTDDPWIENVTAVGTRFLPQWASVAMEPQITLSAREGRHLRNITFFLFGSSPCLHGGEYPVTIRVEKLRFYRSLVEVYTAGAAGYGIFSDLDGSLSGYAGGSVTGDKMYNRHSACRSVGTQDLSLRLLCDASIFIRPLHIAGIEPAELLGKDLSVWTIFGHGNVPYREGWHMAVISAKFQDQLVWPARRWAETGPTPIEWRMLPFWYTLRPDSNVDFQKMRVSFGSPGLMLATEWVGMHFPYSNSPVRRFESSGISGSCFEPYFDWLDRGGYSLWIPEVVFTSTVTSSTTSSTSTTTTSMSFTSTTTSSSSTSTGTTTATDEDDLNDTNDTNETNDTNATTETSTQTTTTSTSATATSSSTTSETRTSTTSTTSLSTTTITRTTTSRTSTTTTTTYLGTRTSTSTETTITMTTTTTSTSTTIPLAAPLRALNIFPEPRFGCAALSFLFEMCERASGLSFGPCMPNGPVIGWTNRTEMVNASLFANGTLSMVMGNREQGNYQDPMVADLVNTGCGEGGCAFFEEARVVMGPPGNWTLPESWPGRNLPQGVETVVNIPPYYHIVYNNFTAIGPVGDLKIHGKLSLAEEEGLKLLVKSIQVFAGGQFQVGTSWAPHKTTAIISFWGATFDSDPAYISLNLDWGKKVFGVYEGNVSLHGRPYASVWGDLFAPAGPGDTLIRVQQDVGDWPVGGEILLTTSEYPNLDGSDTYTERRIITSIVFYAPSTEITIDRPLEKHHFAGEAFRDSSGSLTVRTIVALVSRTILVTTEEALIGAEKFPDPELGVPNPGHGGEWFGFHMLAAGSSFVSMSWVQLDRGGQDGITADTRFPALQFYHPENYFGGLPSPYLEGLSFSDSIMGAIEVLGSWGMDSVNALFVGTRGSVIKAEMDVGPLFILQNLAVSTRRPPERVSLGLPYEPMSVFQLQAKPPVFAGNIVAGCEDIGFLLRPHTCEEVQQQAGDATVNMPNEVFGCVVGFFMLRSCSTAGAGPSSCPDSYDCVHLTHMRAWKNAHVGILFVDQPANMEVSDVQLFDNHIGITGTFHRKMGDMLHSFTMRDSKVYGSTALSNCNASLQCLAVGPGEASPSGCGSLPGPDVRRVGILLPIITNRGKTCEDGPVLRACPLANLPDRNCALPWESRYGTRGSRMSVFRLEDVDFGAFYAEDCGMRSVAIANNPSSRDWNPILEVRGLSWADTSFMPKYLTNASMGYTGPPPLYDHVYTNTRILLEPWWRYPGEETCSRHPLVSETARLKLGMEGSAPICPGVQQTWVRDLDGSLLRESGVALPTGGLLPSSCDSQTSSFLMATYIPSAWPQRCGNETTAQCPAGAHFAYTLEGGLTVCQDRLRLLNWENLDPDCCGFHRRELGLLRATRLSDGMYEESWPMFDDDCARGLEYGRSSYVIRVEAGLPLELRFMGTSQLPRLSRIHFFAESSGHEVLLRLPLGRLRRPRLYIFGINFDIMRRTSIPNAGDSHGAMYLDRERLWLYINARGMPGGSRGQGAIVLQLLEVFVAEVVVFVPLEEFSQFKFVEDLARSLNVSEDRVSLVNITYDGQKWLEGPNGRRLRMVDTLRIEFEVSEDPDILDLAVLLDAPWESMGASDAFFEDSVAQVPPEALSVASIRNLSTTFQVRGVAGLNLSWPVAELRVTNVPEVPETTITRLSCGVNLQGDQVCICEDGWYGPQCDQLCNCTGAGIAGCNEGPEGDGSCYCKPGYVGETCDRCGEYYYNLQNGCAIYCHPDDRCSGNGECTTDPVTHLINGCACYESWDGEDCRQCARNYYPSRVCNVYCDKNTTCSGHGECSDFGTCVCDAGRRGANCDQCEQDYYPPGECSRRCFIGLNCVQGECDGDGYCQCKPNWYGETCSVSCPRCSLEGSWGCNEGREGDGTCSCKTGWDGPVCSDPAEYIETEWSTCEGTCGGFPGVRSRIVRCYNSRSKAILPDERCLGEKPLEQEVCTTPLCSCSVPPPILHADYEKTVGVCSFLQNDRTCRAICDDGYARSGEYKCVASRYVQQPICLPLGDAAHVKEALFSYVTLAGIDLLAVANLTWWYGSISPSLQQVLAAALVPIPGYQVLPEQVTLRAWHEVEWPAQAPRRLAESEYVGNGSVSISRFLQGNMVALEVPFILETEDEYAFGLAESMIQFFADSDVATETTILKALEEKLEELCFTVLPSLRPMRCTAPEMVFIGPPVRTTLFLPPLPPTTQTTTTTTEDRIQIIIDVEEGLPGWAIGVFCILLLLVVFLCGYVWKLRQKKQRREAQVQRLKEKAAKSRSEEELVQEMWETALTDDTGKLKTGVEETLELPDGSSYIGGLQDGDPHGVGKMVWPDGRTYHGNWVFGQPHGQGVMSSIAPVEAEHETWVYSGQFQDGLRHGVGRCEWPAVGAWYEGDWVLDAEHGLGELGAGATESQDGDPHVWCMYNGEKQENVATSRVFPGPEDELMVVVLQAREKEAAELDDVELHLKRYGLSVGNPHVWVARHWSAFVVTWVQQDGPLDRWNWAQLKQVGAGARLVLPNSTIWGVNGVRGDIKAMTEMLLSPKERELTLEVWGPASLRFESIRDDLSKRLGWFKESNVSTEYTGLTFQRKSREAQAHEQSKPWLQRTGLQAASMSATTKSETMSLTQTAPRMTDKPGLPALLRMPEVPAPPSSLVASVVLPKAGARKDEDKPPAKAKAKAGGRKSSAVPPLRWPQAPPAPSEAMPDGTRSLEATAELGAERLRRVAQASTPPMSPH